MRLAMIVIGLMCCLACEIEKEYDETLLHGDWELVEWKNKTTDKLIDADVSFTFDISERYAANYGNASEKGKYWITDVYLHTIEDGKAEKKVKIIKLKADTLIFEMNRIGNIEQMILVKS